MESRESIVYTYIENAVAGRIGYGFIDYYNNPISFGGIETGDIVLGAYPGCAYGKYSHAGIYIGDGQVLESYVDMGITIQLLEHYREYSDIALLRVNTDNETKQRVVDYAKKYQGKLFYPVAFKSGDRFWNCTKIMWKAYYLEGIDLGSEDIWISPDEFYNSPLVSIIREKGR